MVRRRANLNDPVDHDLPFPTGGVEETRSYFRQRHGTCVDALNVRSFDTIQGRARGGSRPGTVKFMDDRAIGDFPIQHLCQIVTNDVRVPATSYGQNVYSISTGFGVASSAGASVFTHTLASHAFACSCWDDDGYIYTILVNTGTGATALYKHTAAGVLQSPFPVTSTTSAFLGVTSGSLRSVCGMVVIGDYIYLAATLAGLSKIVKIHKTTGAISLWRVSSSTTNMVFSTSAVQCMAKIGTLLGVECRASSALQCFKIFDTTKSSTATPITVSYGGTGANNRSCVVSDGIAYFYTIASTTTGIVKKIGIGGGNPLFSSVVFDATGVQSIAYDYSLGYLVGIRTSSPSLVRLSLSTGASVETSDPNSVTSYNWIDSDNNGFFTLYNDGAGSNDTTGVNSTYSVVWGPTTRANTTHSGASVYKGVVQAPKANGNAEVRLLGISNGTLFRFTEDGPVLVTSGAVFAAQDDRSIASAQFGMDRYFMDGAGKWYYKSLTDTVTAWTASAGSFPTDDLTTLPRLMVNWLDRIVLSGIKGDPRSIYMSAAGSATDFDYDPAAESATQAFALSIEDTVNALIRGKDDLLIVGCDHMIKQLTGDPGIGGRFDTISDTIGIAWNTPYALDPVGQIYFFSTKGGIWKLTPGGGPPVRVSQQIEERLGAINLDTCRVSMAWDMDAQGLEVWCTPYDSTVNGTNFFYEERVNAWWPQEYSRKEHCPLAVHVYDGPSANDRMTLIGGRDGYIRRVSYDAATDDNRTIHSRVMMGPFKTNSLDLIKLWSLLGVLGKGSGTVSCKVYVGRTPEEALASDAAKTFTWTEGRNFLNYVNRTGFAIYVELSSEEVWALEKIVSVYSTEGRIRRGM